MSASDRSISTVESEERPPTLIVDLDGTLTRTDTLYESLMGALRHRPSLLLRLPQALLRGRAELKRTIADAGSIEVDSLPFREDLLAYIAQERAKGRRIVLATAADDAIAQAVAARLAVFDEVYASDGVTNLKGMRKLARLIESEGPDFVYAGDSRADLPIWRASRAAVLVGVSDQIAAAVSGSVPVERRFVDQRTPVKDWARLLRLHQWLKNLLIFVPLLTSFSLFDLERVTLSVQAFLAFCALASSTYIVNDLLDLKSDRSHPRKRFRPLASAAVPFPNAAVASCVLALLAAIMAFGVSTAFAMVLGAYLGSTLLYSLMIKRYVLADVLMLAFLYTLRVFAGAVAIGVTLSPWLLAFSIFIFLSLALVKRCSELVSMRSEGIERAVGRDYGVSDLVVLWPLGVGAGMCAIVVFGLFIAAVSESQLYGNPALLWLTGIGMIYWVGRLWIKTARGEMHDDPIVFTLRDRGTRVVLAAILVCTLLAHLG